MRRNPESGEPDIIHVVDEDIRWLNVFMDETLRMGLTECCRQANGDVQSAHQVNRSALIPLENQIQTLTTRILKYEDRPPFMAGERERLSCPPRIEVSCERVFVLEPPKPLR
ncbi:MAG: hypothetical protein WA700_07210 [Acidobacteriaceae bacterium]